MTMNKTLLTVLAIAVLGTGPTHGADAGNWLALFDGETLEGWLFNLEDNEEAREAFKQNEWNHLRIEARGSNIKTWVNGVPAANLDDSMTATGFIALQVHGSKKPEGHEVRWRNIRIIDLDRSGTSDAPSTN